MGDAVGIRAEHRAGQAVGGVVGDAHGVVVAVVRQDHQDGAEDLLLCDPGLVVQSCDQGRFDEESLVVFGGPAAADDDRAAFLDRELQVALDAVALARGNQWSADGSGLVRIAGPDTPQALAVSSTASS